MNIYMWSGPRNVSTALMRSFENRDDTFVWDEPLYSYYLKETGKTHPIGKEIINTYSFDLNEIIKNISKDYGTKKIHYQKHMAHHILEKTPIDWIKFGINCFLIRHPKEVISSYIKKNKLIESFDIGFPNQFRIFKRVIDLNQNLIVINAKDLLNNPTNILQKLCNKLNISYDNKMLNWPKGPRDSDGIWSKFWYGSVNQSSGFEIHKNQEFKIPSKYTDIYKECLEIYSELNSYSLNNENK